MYTKEDCIRAIRKADGLVDGPLTVDEYSEIATSGPAIRTIYDKFESWNNAKENAGVKTLKHGETKSQHLDVGFRTDSEGYVRIATKLNGTRRRIGVHRLVAVSEYGFDAVSGKVVHHKNEVPWDNRPENLELMGHAEHARYHRMQDASES